MAVCKKKEDVFFVGMGGGGGGGGGVWRKHSHSLAYVIFSQLSNIQFFNYGSCYSKWNTNKSKVLEYCALEAQKDNSCSRQDTNSSQPCTKTR